VTENKEVYALGKGKQGIVIFDEIDMCQHRSLLGNRREYGKLF
jgi:hypothetical protein